MEVLLVRCLAQGSLLESKKTKNEFWLELPENTRAMLVSAIYSGEDQKVYLKFYVPSLDSICFWPDATKHKPYCYTKIDYKTTLEQIISNDKRFSMALENKTDLISDKEIQVLKITAPDPLSIGGTENSIREKLTAWEADIKYHENYLYDSRLIPGSYYIRIGNKIIEERYEISKTVEEALKNLLWDRMIDGAKEAGNDKYRKYITEWANLLNQPIPSMKRIAVDIEVDSEEGRIPNPREHDRKITAVGLVSSDGLKKVLILQKDDSREDNSMLTPAVEICKTEKELLQKAFSIIWSYPIVLTFNGDDFDLPYLYSRAQDSRIDPVSNSTIPKEEIPILIKRESFIKKGIQADPVQLKHGIHIDLFRTFQNRSIQIYAFSHKYSEFRLGAISEALLNDGKIDFDGNISELSTEKLAEYCLKDADLTFRLTSFNDDLLMKLLVAIARISRLSIEDVSRFGVNQWIRGMLYFEHRKINALIPRRDELLTKGQASTTAIIKEKKYRGGLVVEPTAGIHFNVVVVDFASLYPSIIKVHNLSYETVNCPHLECQNDPSQNIPNTNHWICKKRRGITSLLIGSLRDLRVGYYKQLSKDKSLAYDERQLYVVVSQAIKVILNASYGVMGAEIFPLYCLPVADATAAIGRDTTTKTIQKCQEIGIEVVYGDTDSLFLKDPTEGRVEEVSKWARVNLGIDLELDKEYRYVVFSDLKKNYLGVLKDGTVDVKGLTGKKSHTPPFIRRAFYQVLDILSNVNTASDFTSAKVKIIEVIKENALKLEANEIPLPDLTFNVMVNKSPEKYGIKLADNFKNFSIDGTGNDIASFKGLPQHIKAAKLLSGSGKEVKVGHIISYVKTKTTDGVKPVELASFNEIDKEKYLEAIESTFDQLLSVLNVNFKSIIGKPRQANLDELFWKRS
ncbi:MAG: DNA-directed DNA polymerase I [Nitrososphaeraceae archaeon]